MDRRKGKNLKYFLGLEKCNYVNKLISKLEIEGKEITSPVEISEAQTKYYQHLYSDKLNQRNQNYTDSLNKFLINNDMLKFDSEQRISITVL